MAKKTTKLELSPSVLRDLVRLQTGIGSWEDHSFVIQASDDVITAAATLTDVCQCVAGNWDLSSSSFSCAHADIRFILTFPEDVKGWYFKNSHLILTMDGGGQEEIKLTERAVTLTEVDFAALSTNTGLIEIDISNLHISSWFTSVIEEGQPFYPVPVPETCSVSSDSSGFRVFLPDGRSIVFPVEFPVSSPVKLPFNWMFAIANLFFGKNSKLWLPSGKEPVYARNFEDNISLVVFRNGEGVVDAHPVIDADYEEVDAEELEAASAL